jgi:UDP-2,3-diacylglucosamine pyrophosphatase LpxH
LLIEHGNRFDEWNAVSHGALRRVRSQLSRGLPVKPEFPALPGSRLVIDVMNPLKEQYPFIDLLKPEDAAALPIAAALGAAGIRDVWQFFQRYRQSWSVDYDETKEPLDQEYIAAAESSDQELYDLAQDLQRGGDASQVNAVGDLLGGAAHVIDERVRKLRRAALFKALSATKAKQHDALDVEKEAANYCTAARHTSEAGFRVIVYGHTHLAKRVDLGNGAKYLNTGTWADLMRVPDAVWDADEVHAKEAMESFVDDLETSTLGRWRRSVPTYAKIEIDGDDVVNADVYFADGDGTKAIESRELWRRLAAKDTNA